MRRIGLAILAAAALSFPASAAQLPGDYRDALELFAAGAKPDDIPGGLLKGRAFRFDSSEPPEDAYLLGPGSTPPDDLPSASVIFKAPGSGAASWIEAGRAYELREAQGLLLLQVRLVDGSRPPLYAAFTPESPAPRLSFGGSLVLEQNRGNTPLFNRGFTGPYVSGPGVSADLTLRARRDSRSFPALDVLVRPAYAAGGALASQGRFDLLARADLAVRRQFGLQAGYQVGLDRGAPAAYARTPGTLPLQRTWVGVRVMPFGFDAKSGVEAFFNLSEIPGGSKKHIGPNNWPVRIRGEGPAVGWDIGLEGKHTMQRPVKLPALPVTLRNVEWIARGTILASTPFDNPEMVRVLIQVSADVTKRLFIRIRNENSANINRDVLPDPNSSRPGSMVHTTTVGLGFRF